MAACVRFRTSLPLILLLSCASRNPPLREDPPPACGRTLIWVDPAGEGPGDGSRARPLNSLTEALARPGPLTVRLAPGRYVGPFMLPPGACLEGGGAGVVLEGLAPDGPVLRVGQSASVSDVVVKGGGWGLDMASGAEVRLTRVGFWGQHSGAVRVRAGRLDVEGGQFEAPSPAAVGIWVESEQAPGAVSTLPDGSLVASAEARIRKSVFKGPYRRAVRVRGAGGVALVEDTRFSGPATAVGVDGAHAEVRRSRSEGGDAAGFSVMDGTLLLEHVEVTGHEYGVSAMRARGLDVHHFTSTRAVRAGMGLSMSRARLRDIVVRDSGAYGGLQFVGGDLDVQRIQLEGSAEYGLMALRGKLRLRDASITGVRTADGVGGDALHLRQLEADVKGVVVRGAQGACVLAAQDARVSLRDADLESCGHVGLLTDTLARMDAKDVRIRGAATALGALGDGELRVDGLTATGLLDGLVQAGCGGATQVLLGAIRSDDTRGASAACVHRDTQHPSPSP